MYIDIHIHILFIRAICMYAQTYMNAYVRTNADMHIITEIDIETHTHAITLRNVA
jgi:hypothetical protein